MTIEAEVLSTIADARKAGIRVCVRYSPYGAVESIRIDAPGQPRKYLDPWEAVDRLKRAMTTEA